MRVSLQCGPRNQLLSVDEPSRCMYAATMATPVICHEGAIENVRESIRELTGDATYTRAGSPVSTPSMQEEL
jgi:hypothetical protein